MSTEPLLQRTDQMSLANLTQRFHSTRTYTEDLCAPLQTEDYIPQAVEFTSPPRWHLAHTSWFFEELLLKKYDSSYQEFNPEFNFLFNSYYNTIGRRIPRHHRGIITRPSVAEVYQYRHHITTHVLKMLSSPPADTDIEAVIEIVEIGIQHEQQHQELLITDLKYTFGLNPIFPVYSSRGSLVDDTNSDTKHLAQHVSIDEGVYSIGHKTDSFCYDNELGVHNVYLPSYKLSTGLITNAEYMEFMEDGGYNDFRHWLDEGWAWVQQNNANAPLYWHHIDGQWYYYTLEGLKKVHPHAILAHINHYEASAFAQWRGQRLPTEFEWEVASDKIKWGKRWEWTSSAYLPYPDFRRIDGAIGEYNGKFMSNQIVLRGASTATPPHHSRHTYRNFFHPHLQWQLTGIRLIVD